MYTLYPTNYILCTDTYENSPTNYYTTIECTNMECRRFGLSTFPFVNVLVCRRFGLSTFWFVDFSVCRRFGLSTFRSVDVTVCRRFGLSMFRFVRVLVWQRFGLSTFRFVEVLVVDVSVCRRFDQLPIHILKPQCSEFPMTWWRHQMETFSALVALFEGNSPVTGEFPSHRPVTRSFDVFFDLRLSKRFYKQSRRWWFETPSWSWWQHCNWYVTVLLITLYVTVYPCIDYRYGVIRKNIYNFCRNWRGFFPLRWRHNEHDGVSNHQHHGCLLNRLFRRRSKKTTKLRVTGLCVGISPGPVNSPHKGPVTRKMFPFDDVIMQGNYPVLACRVDALLTKDGMVPF